jgi:hypothetical protein
MERNRNDVGYALRLDGHQGQHSVGARSGWCGGASTRCDRGDPSGVLDPNSPSPMPTFRAMDRAEIEYIVLDITEILRLMRHADSGE